MRITSGDLKNPLRLYGGHGKAVHVAIILSYKWSIHNFSRNDKSG